MSKEIFNPSAPEFKKVEDLPEEEKSKFENVEGGFVRKEAKEELENAQKVVELANVLKKAGVTAKDIHGRTNGILKEIRTVFTDDEITTNNVLRNRALKEEFKPVDFLHEKANEIHSKEYPEDIYIERLRNNPEILKGIPKYIWGRKRFALEAVKLNRKALDKIGFGRHSLRDNDYIEVVYEAVRHDGLALQYAGNKSRDNKDIVLEAIKQNPDAIKFASNDIKNEIKQLLGE